MKFMKKFLAVSMTAAMAVSVSACGGETGGQDAEALVKTATETMASVTSMSSEMTMDFTMSLEDETMDMTSKAIMDTIYGENLKIKMDVSAETAGEPVQAYSMYMEQNGDTIDAYMDIGDGTWYQQSLTLEDISQYDAQANAEMYLQSMEDLKIDGTEELNGHSTSIVSGVFTGESMRDAMASSGIESLTESMGLTEEDMETVLNSISDMPVKMWISEEGYIVKYEIDMTGMMQSLMDNMLAAAAQTTEEVPLVISKTMVTMTCDNFNAVEDFEIPADAAAAV